MATAEEIILENPKVYFMDLFNASESLDILIERSQEELRKQILAEIRKGSLG